MNNQSQQIQEYIEESKKRAIDVFEKGNFIGAAYLAHVFGAYAYILKLDSKSNPFFDNDYKYSLLYIWYNAGYDDSRQAVLLNETLKNKFSKYEEEEAKKNKKKSFWSLRK